MSAPLLHGAGAQTQTTREDLVTYRLSELWWLEKERGARAYIYQARPGLFHVVVKRADGALEDPSARLGMYDTPPHPVSVLGRALRIGGV